MSARVNDKARFRQHRGRRRVVRQVTTSADYRGHVWRRRQQQTASRQLQLLSRQFNSSTWPSSSLFPVQRLLNTDADYSRLQQRRQRRRVGSSASRLTQNWIRQTIPGVYVNEQNRRNAINRDDVTSQDADPSDRASTFNDASHIAPTSDDYPESRSDRPLFSPTPSEHRCHVEPLCLSNHYRKSRIRSFDWSRHITNRKSHTGFRWVPTSITLNDLERRSPYFAFFFTEFDGLSGRLYHSGWR